MASPIGKTIAFEGTTVSYTTYNVTSQLDKPVLIFIHGWCCSSSLWTPQSPLYPKHASILIDLPGHGQSSKPEGTDYSIEFFARAISAALDAEGVSNAILIGHSLGGVVATTVLRLLGEERVKAIIYISSFWLLPAHYISVTQRAQWRSALADDGNLWAMFEGSFTEAKSKAETIAKVKKMMVDETPVHVRLSAGCTDTIPHHWRWEEVYGKIPMLHVTSVEAPEWDEQSKRHLPNLRVEKWEDVSFFLFMDNPGKFNARVEEFLDENHLG